LLFQITRTRTRADLSEWLILVLFTLPPPTLVTRTRTRTLKKNVWCTRTRTRAHEMLTREQVCSSVTCTCGGCVGHPEVMLI
jgi:hypothetical protein